MPQINEQISWLQENAKACEERRDASVWESKSYWLWHQKASQWHKQAQQLDR